MLSVKIKGIIQFQKLNVHSKGFLGLMIGLGQKDFQHLYVVRGKKSVKCNDLTAPVFIHGCSFDAVSIFYDFTLVDMQKSRPFSGPAFRTW